MIPPPHNQVDNYGTLVTLGGCTHQRTAWLGDKSGLIWEATENLDAVNGDDVDG